MRRRHWSVTTVLLFAMVVFTSLAVADDPPPQPDPDPAEEGEMEEEGVPALSIISLDPVESAKAALASIAAMIRR